MAVIQIIPNKKYKIETYTGLDINGRKKRKCEIVYGKKSDAKARDNELKLRLKKGLSIENSSISLKELSDIWMEQHVIAKCSYQTIASYKQMLPIVLSELGSYSINKITPLMLETFYNKLRNKSANRKLTENTILHYYTMINGMLNKGINWQIIEFNPNKKVNRPKIVKKEIPCYNIEQVKILLEVTKNECLKYQVIIYLALDTGARRGELTGLEWNDIDFKNKTISINRVTQVYENKIIEKENPKNNSSVRTIQITDETLKILELYKQEQDELKKLLGSKWRSTNKVLIDEFGGLMHPDTPSKIFYKIADKCKLPHIKFHSLRHTSASLLIALGVPTKAISKRLGHKSITTTDSIYSHVFSGLDSEAANKLSNVFK